MNSKTCLALLFSLGLIASCSSKDSANKVSANPSTENSPTVYSSATDETKADGNADALGSLPGDESVNRPEQVTGAYLTATVITSTNPASIQVGIVGKIEDTRISDAPENYKSTWTLEFAKAIPVTVTLTKSKLADFDQILEFAGSKAQFDQYAADIQVSLAFQQNLNGAIVSSVVADHLSEIVADAAESAALTKSAPH